MARIVELTTSDKNTSVKGQKHEKIYVVFDTDDWQEADSLVAATAPEEIVYGDLVLERNELTVSPTNAGDVWECTVSYKLPNPAGDDQKNPPQNGTMRVSIDTSGGTQKIYQSIETLRFYKGDWDGTPPDPDFKGAIGVTKDSIEGTDIVVPTFKYQITAYIDAADVTDAYINSFFLLTGKTNDADFKGFKKGEALLVGARLQTNGEKQAQAQFDFACSPNRTDLKIGDITGIKKGGWEYLWVYYEPDPNDEQKKIIKRARYVMIEKVYNSGDFSALGLDS